ncbi:uncharacterized protein ZBAI_01794 [Zygosaccharomyces bailii ISA1307]|nr:uncharacterized protein ZBAI_01794 [Zygosaccharomyces bailii ISA1307]
MEKLYLLNEEPSKNSMIQKEYGDTLPRNAIPHRHATSPRLSYSCIGDAQCNENDRPGVQRRENSSRGAQRSSNSGPGAQRSDGPAHTEEVSSEVKLIALKIMKALGSGLNIAHLILLAAYGSLGLSSRDDDNYSSIFVYGGSIITVASHIILYCADTNKLTSSIFERGQAESMGSYWAKAGLLVVVLPIFNSIGLIVMFVNGQDRKNFWSGIFAFSAYLLGNTLLFLSKGENTRSEEYELRENSPLADNAPVSNLPAANSPANDAPATNSLIDNSSVDNSPLNNSPRPSIRTFP